MTRLILIIGALLCILASVVIGLLILYFVNSLTPLAVGGLAAVAQLFLLAGILAAVFSFFPKYYDKRK